MKSANSEFPEIINQHCSSYLLASAMLTGIKLDIFTHLSNGPKSTTELSSILNVNEKRLSPLLYMLVNTDLLTIHSNKFANSHEADQFLVKGRPDFKGQFISFMMDTVQKTEESIRTNIPQAKVDFGSFPQEVLLEIYKNFHPRTLKAGAELAQKLNIAQYSHLLDVAGGSGGLAIGACETCPDLNATVVELPNIAPITKKFISNAEMSDRIHVVANDIVDQPPEGKYDIAIIRNFIQTISMDQAIDSLKNIYTSLVPGGIIQILGKVLSDTRLAPEQSVNFNLVFLNIYDNGIAYSESEYTDWLLDVGFVDINIQNDIPPDGEALITAYKPE